MGRAIAGVFVLTGFLLVHPLAAIRLVAQERDAVVAQGQALFTNQGCHGCHTIGTMGTPIAPDLSHVGRKYREAELALWFMDPSAPRPMRHMPRIQMKDAEARALAAYLASLR